MSLGSVMSVAPQGALGLCPAALQRPMPVTSSFIVPLKARALQQIVPWAGPWTRLGTLSNNTSPFTPLCGFVSRMLWKGRMEWQAKSSVHQE